MIPSRSEIYHATILRKEQSPSSMHNDQAHLHQGTDDEEYEDNFESIRTQRTQTISPTTAANDTSTSNKNASTSGSLEPYIGKLERFELFSTNQCYYIVACDKYNLQYRVIKMDRTLIEYSPEETTAAQQESSGASMAAASPSVDMRRSDNQQPDNVSTADSASEQGGTQQAQHQQTPPPPMDAAHKPKPTLRPLGDFLTEDEHTYSQREIQEMLDMIHFGNRYTNADGTAREGGKDGGGGLKPLAKGYGIVGFIRFLDCYYLTLITRRAKVGSIGYNGVYTIKDVETFALKPAERHHGYGEHDPLTDPSAMLLNMWNRGKRSVGLGLSNREIAELRYQGLYQVVDFTKNFYFSYTYDLTRSLQENFLVTKTQPFPPPPYKDMYAWNFFLTREFEDCISSLTSYHWVMPIIHGAYVQRKLNDYGRTLNLMLVARRSRHFAGTRYLKRGVSEQGKVANDVEHEQILHDETNIGAFSSYLQVRGSIPVYWTQESSVTMPKPPIEINRVDPTYRATQAHFEDLMKRYAGPIVVLDLVKQSEKREREVRVGNEYRHAIDYINTSIDDTKYKIRYCALDYSHVSKHRHLDVSSSLNEVSTFAVNQTGFFCSSPQWKIMPGGKIIPFGEEDKKTTELLSKRLGVVVFPMEQRGALRTNCIDCLDRTNVAQFSAGVEALEQQMAVMGIRSSATLLPTANIIRCLIDMYVEIGDHISLQYGGSEAHKKVQSDRSEWHGPIGKHKELLTSIRRYYSNAFTDRLKQDAMNLLLGYYVPYRHTIPLWEMETDYYLHNLHVKSGKGMFHTMKSYQLAFGLPASGIENDECEDYDGPQLGHHSSKINRVRKRLEEQNESLSSWWKVAIQSNIQQRMWMQLTNDSEWPLPPRFDRIYQPNKLAQFDRFFARTWATPLRRSHGAQHRSDEEEESEKLDYRKAISDSTLQTDKPHEQSTHAESGTLLAEYYRETEYQPSDKNALELFVRNHSKDNGPKTDNETRHLDRPFLGSLNVHEKPRQEYVDYVLPGESFSRKPFDPDKVKEFEGCLHETNLHSDDVDGICKLSASAHIGNTIQVGFYKGLEQNESALDVTTIIVEQFNALSSGNKNDEIGGMHIVDEELKRRGYHTVGVREAVARGWERKKMAQAEYAEICSQASSAPCRRSHLTTAESLGRYASFYDDSTELSNHDLTYLNATRKQSVGPANFRRQESMAKETGSDKEPRSFVRKAAEMGIAIRQGDDIAKARSVPLFNFEHDIDVRQGFEQINEDLFARKHNKFCVLNGAGMEAWDGTDPLTNVTAKDSLEAFSNVTLHETNSANRRH